MTRSLLQDPFDHHAWATLRIIDACLTLTADQLATNVPGTYGSIIDTVRHIVGADAAYLFVLTGGRFHEIEEAEMALPELRSVAEACGPAWTELLADDLDPGADIVRHRDDGSTSTAPLGIRIGQAIQHGTDHRSQICTALTTLGLEPPDIDVWAFADSQGRLSETQPAA